MYISFKVGSNIFLFAIEKIKYNFITFIICVYKFFDERFVWILWREHVGETYDFDVIIR